MSDSETSGPTEESGSGSGTPPPRPLLRRDQHKHLAGVAGGLADYLGIDAAVVRLAFVILALFGIGIPLYIVGWLAMPSALMPQSHIEKWFGATPGPAAVIAIAGAVIVLFAIADGFGHDGDGLGWGLALLFGGWLLFRADSRATASVGAPPAGTPGVSGPPLPPPSTWRGAGGGGMTEPFVYAPPPPPPPPRERSILGRVTIGVALAALGVAALLDQVGAISLEAVQYFALALTITGLGLVVGAWAGRAYGLIALGFLLIPPILVLSLAPLPLHLGFGDAAAQPQAVSELDTEFGVAAGRYVLDLTEIDWAGQTATANVVVGVGETRVVIPDTVTVRATVDMKVGEANVFGEKHVGDPFPEPVAETAEGSPGGGRLDLNVDNAVGKVTVEQASVPGSEF